MRKPNTFLWSSHLFRCVSKLIGWWRHQCAAAAAVAAGVILQECSWQWGFIQMRVFDRFEHWFSFLFCANHHQHCHFALYLNGFDDFTVHQTMIPRYFHNAPITQVLINVIVLWKGNWENERRAFFYFAYLILFWITCISTVLCCVVLECNEPNRLISNLHFKTD